MLSSVHKIIKDFDGSVAFKNLEREYFFVNEKWLEIANLKKEDVIGKTANEFMSPENAALANKTDLQAIEQNTPVEYTSEVILNEKILTYISIKWVLNFIHDKPFFICNLSALTTDRDKVLAFRDTINEIFKRKK